MKNLIFVMLFGLASQSAMAQVEVKTNPIGLIFEAFPLSIEVVTADSWGVELDAFASSGLDFLYLSGKHYFNPHRRADGFNIGAFMGGAGNDEGDDGFGLGFFAGYKAVSAQNVLLEIALGLGRDFTDDIGVLPYFKLHVGYRFGR